MNLLNSKKKRTTLPPETKFTINPEGRKCEIEKRYSFCDQIFYDADELSTWIKSTRVPTRPHLTKPCVSTVKGWPSPFVLRDQIETFCFENFRLAKVAPGIFETMKASDAAGDVIFKKLRKKILNPYLGYEQLSRVTSGLLNFPLLKAFESQGGGPKRLITRSETLFHIDLVITWLEKKTKILTFERRKYVRNPNLGKDHEKPRRNNKTQ